MVGPLPTRSPADVREAVRREAPGLRRTAVMLTGGGLPADTLVADVLRHDRQGGSHEALVTALVRAFLRQAHHAHGDEVEPHRHGPARGGAGRPAADGVAAVDPGDVLASLRPRERAAAVLLLVEGWSPERTAHAMHVQTRRTTVLVPPVDGLRLALEAVADQHYRPARAVVADVLAALPPVEVPAGARDPGPADRGARPDASAPRSGRHQLRPWTWRLLAGAVLLGLLVWVSALGRSTGERERAGPPDAPRSTVALVDGSTLATDGSDLAARGWVLDAAGEPPVDLEGLRLVDLARIGLTRPDVAVRVDTEPRRGAAVFGVLWCDVPAVDANLRPPTARLTVGGEAVELPCAGTGGAPAVRRLVPLPPAPGPGRATMTVTWSGDVPARGEALLATYTETGAGPPPSPRDGSAPPEGSTHGAASVPPVVDGRTVVIGPSTRAYEVQDRTVHHRRVRIGAGSTVMVWAGSVGGLTVQLDDVVLTDDGDRSWRSADPELRDGRWLAYGPGRARSLAVPDRVRPAAGRKHVVTVSVTGTVERDRWQVHVTDALAVRELRPPVPPGEAPPDVPRWVAGYRLAASWPVPGDGVPQLLVDPGLSPGRRFVLVGPRAVTDADPRSAVVPHVATTRGPVEVPVVRDVADAFGAEVWRPGDHQVRVGAGTADVRTGAGTAVLSATAPAGPGGAPPTTLLAYEPVPYADFDLTSAPPVSASVLLADSRDARTTPPPGTPYRRSDSPAPRLAGRWTRADVDEAGHLSLALRRGSAEGRGTATGEANTAVVRLTTAGAGRVQVLQDGRPVLWLPDGWWTPWTAEPVVTDLPVPAPRRPTDATSPLQLRVEGHEELFVVELLTGGGADGAPGDT